ncbi:MAG: hypothetical protein L0G82_09660 [Pseudomonas sp.]|nr:hypothetical protein [Pseudomonas sp.]
MKGQLLEGQPTLAQQLRKLDIRDGDLVLCLPAHTSPEQAQDFLHMLAELRPGQRFAVVIGDIQTMDEAAMNAAGWYRK